MMVCTRSDVTLIQAQNLGPNLNPALQEDHCEIDT